MTRKRIVTGFDSHGRSVIVDDGPWPGQWDRGENEYFDWLWVITDVPAPLDVSETTSGGVGRLVPEGNEIVVRVATLLPRSEIEKLSDEARETRQSRLDFAETESVPDDPGMHRTPTLDIIVVLSGEVDLALDSGQIAHLQPGDSVIQRGTMHSWIVTGAAPCVMASVMVRGTNGASGVAASDSTAPSMDTRGTENY